MSGDRHHFIPQFLQRNFLCSERKKGSITHVYRKNGHYFPSNVTNTNVENKFYTSDSLDADEKITREENKILEILRKDNFDPYEMATVITHFEIRTKNLRVMFTSAIDDLLQAAYKKILDDKYLKNLLKKLFENNPNIIEDEFNKLQDVHKLPPKLKKKLIKDANKGKSKTIAFFVDSYLAVAHEQFKIYSSEIEKSIKNGHLKILQQNTSLEKRVKRYEQFHYTCYYIDDSSMILGDSVVAFEVYSDGQVKWKQYSDINDEIISIVMPLASNKIIIGVKNNIINYKPNIPSIKIALAQCSLEQFISSRKSDENNELAKHIGTVSPPLTQSEINNIVIDGFEKAVLKRD